VDRGQLPQVVQEIESLGVCTPRCLESLRALREAFPGDSEVRAILKRVYLERRLWDSLLELEADRPVSARSPAERVELASIQINAGRFADATLVLEPLLASAPADPEVARLAGQAFFHLGDYERAAPLLDRAMAGLRDEEGAEAATYRGLVLLHRGEEAKAEEMLRTATRRAPHYLPAYHALGRVLAARGADQEAQEALGRARRLQEAATAVERRQLRLAALSRKASDAFQEGRYDDGERVVATMLEGADEDVQLRLYRYLVQVRRAAGRTAAAEAALDHVRRLERREGRR
jgi:Flp pilus assembly protein TadD